MKRDGYLGQASSSRRLLAGNVYFSHDASYGSCAHESGLFSWPGASTWNSPAIAATPDAGRQYRLSPPASERLWQSKTCRWSRTSVAYASGQRAPHVCQRLVGAPRRPAFCTRDCPGISCMIVAAILNCTMTGCLRTHRTQDVYVSSEVLSRTCEIARTERDYGFLEGACSGGSTTPDCARDWRCECYSGYGLYCHVRRSAGR
jgi:hypothetical protein